MFRLRARIESDSDGGWWCAAILFSGPRADQLVEHDQMLRVGPFPSEAAARAELTGKFRELAMEGFRAFSAAHGGRTIASAVDGETFTPAELNAAAGIGGGDSGD